MNLNIVSFCKHICIYSLGEEGASLSAECSNDLLTNFLLVYVALGHALTSFSSLNHVFNFYLICHFHVLVNINLDLSINTG